MSHHWLFQKKKNGHTVQMNLSIGEQNSQNISSWNNLKKMQIFVMCSQIWAFFLVFWELFMHHCESCVLLITSCCISYRSATFLTLYHNNDCLWLLKVNVFFWRGFVLSVAHCLHCKQSALVQFKRRRQRQTERDLRAAAKSRASLEAWVQSSSRPAAESYSLKHSVASSYTLSTSECFQLCSSHSNLTPA